jgi:hypothetical protein
MSVLLLPQVYSTMILETSAHALSALQFLLSHPTVARSVKELIIRPLQYAVVKRPRTTRMNSSLTPPPQRKVLKEMEEVVDLLCSLAVYLVRLEKFEWLGWDLPQRDEIWNLLMIQWVIFSYFFPIDSY